MIDQNAPAPIKERISSALKAANGRMNYHDLMRAVFPQDIFPKSWNRSANGGPVACARVFGKALREMGCNEHNTERFGRGVISLPRALISALNEKTKETT